MYVKVLLLFEELSRFKRKVIVNTELTIDTQLNTPIMGEFIYDKRTCTLPRRAQNERAYLAAGEVLDIEVDMSRTKHEAGIVRKHQDVGIFRALDVLISAPPQRELHIRLTTAGRKNANDLNFMPTNKLVRATARA